MGGDPVVSDSMIYSIGTALNRARDNGAPVEVLVEGMWVKGSVLAVDGFGVVLQDEEERHSVVRIESISAVTICAPAPHRSHAGAPREAIERVHAMPAPRQAYG